MSDSTQMAFRGRAGPEGSHLMFPAILFGSMKDVRPVWRRLMNRALKQRNWGDSLDVLECVPIGVDDSLIQPCRAMWSAGVPTAWRLTLVGEEFEKWSIAGRDRFSIEEYVPLLTSQMHRLWFALGTMGAEGSLRPARHSYSTAERKVMVSFCSRFVRWLPKMVGLQHRFFYHTMLPEDRMHLPMMRSSWSNTFVEICENLGFDITPQYIMNVQNGDLISALLQKGVVTQDGHEFRFTISE